MTADHTLPDGTISPGVQGGESLSGAAPTVYEAAARVYAEQIYRGARTIDGQPKAWDLLLEHDRRGLLATMRPVVDVVLSFGPLIDFPDQTCPDCRLEHPGADCQQPDLFGGKGGCAR